MLAHRFMWMLVSGAIMGKHVLHRCDNPSCVNPFHLFLGDQIINNADCVSKGRARKASGETCHFAKLTADDVHAIRAVYAANLMSRGYLKTGIRTELATRFGVSECTITHIGRGKRTWKHLK